MPRLSAVGISGLQAGEDVKLAEYVAQQWAILREYGLIKGERE